jgi:hypothetical protein
MGGMLATGLDTAYPIILTKLLTRDFASSSKRKWLGK